MCGIAGAIDADGGRAAARVSMLNDLQRHRGPDHSVVTRVGVFTIGNTRLAIQDPTPAGNQPFVSADGRYHCVFNGEIYNYRRLVERYRLPVRTACDGGVIPELWAKLGVASLAELRGMFVIALVDSLEERLYLARDPFGIKPLYWRALQDGRIVFASEVRPLVRVASGVRIDCQAVARYLNFGAMAADQAPFLEITALPPNSVAAFDRDNRVTVQPIVPGGPLGCTKSAAGFGVALTDSIDLHLGADVPTALLLSAGMDSATIAAVGRRLGRDLHCVTVAAEGPADESAGAAETARQFGHHFQRLPVALQEGDVAGFFGAMQRPTIDGLNTYLISKAVHDAGFKVALSGLGGDEAVGGYAHFRLLRYLPAFRTVERMPGAVTGAVAGILKRMGLASEPKARELLGRGGPRDARGLSRLQRGVLPAPLVADLLGSGWPTAVDAAAPGIAGSSRSFQAMVAAEVAIYLQATLLPDADAFSMAWSVEMRVPFVDSHVFSAALGLALSKSTPPGKAAIGAALDDPHLTRLATRPKRGFCVPMRYWMAGPLASVLRAAEEPNAAVWSVVDRAVAERAGLIPLGLRARWAETWAIAALNAWLTSIAS